MTTRSSVPMRRGMSASRLVAAIALTTAAALSAVMATAQDFQLKEATDILNPSDRLLSDITAVGRKLVAVGERGLILVSSDNGASWTQASVPVSATLTAVSFPTPELGWAVGHAGVILHSADGGTTWEVQFDGNEANSQWLAYTGESKTALEQRVEEVRAAEDPEGILADLEYDLEDAEFNIEDAEAALETGPADPMLDVLFTSSTHGWAVGAYGMVYRTRNGGANWELAVAGVDNPDRYHFYAVANDANGNLYLSGEAGLLYHSSDDGQSWTRHEDVYIGSLFGMVARGSDIYAYGLRGNIFFSSDGGNTWQGVTNPTSFSLYGGSLLEDGDILLVGAGGGTLRLGPENQLQTGTQPSRATLSSVAQRNGDDAVIVGMEGVENYVGSTGDQQ